MDTKQPEALRLAHIFEHPLPPEWSDMVAATKELRRQHAENETLRAGLDAVRLEIESLQKAATGRHALQATGAHCARYCEAQAFRITLRNLHAENERLRTYNKDARHEIANLQERVQELEAQLAAVGAGGVEPLRKRECLHQISEPAQPAAQAAPEDASARFKAQHEFLIWNREQTPPPIESATEYSVFNQAVDFYIAARAAQEGK